MMKIASAIAAVGIAGITAYGFTALTVQSQPRSQSEWGGESVGNPMNRYDTAYPFTYKDYGYSQAVPRVVVRPHPRVRKPRTAIINPANRR